MFRTIVWATDGSKLADGGLVHVRELAGQHGSRIVAVHANELLGGRAGGAPLLAERRSRRDARDSHRQQGRRDAHRPRLRRTSRPTWSWSERTATAASPPHSWAASPVRSATRRARRCSSCRRRSARRRGAVDAQLTAVWAQHGGRARSPPADRL